jgi:hypothetical protein
MKNKIKLVGYFMSAMILTAPALALAQFSAPAGTGLPVNSVFEIISNIMYWLLAIVGIIGVIGFAIAGILYLTAAGDETRIEKAKQAMLYSIIGVVVALAGLVALQFASGILGGENRF